MDYTFNVPNQTGGMDLALAQTSQTVPIFVPMFLLFVYLFVFILGMRKQGERTTVIDAPVWSTVAGLATTIIALMLSLADGIITTRVLVVTFSITILSALWLFLSKNRNEV